MIEHHIVIDREAGQDDRTVQIEDSLDDEIRRMTMFRLTAKIRAFDSYLEASNKLKVQWKLFLRKIKGIYDNHTFVISER